MTASLPAAALLLSPHGAALVGGQALKATATWRTSAVTLTRRPRRLPPRNYLPSVRHTAALGRSCRCRLRTPTTVCWFHPTAACREPSCTCALRAPPACCALAACLLC